MFHTYTKIRPCGVSWSYCDGICTGCIKNKIKPTTSTVDNIAYRKQTTTDKKTRWIAYGVENKEA